MKTRSKTMNRLLSLALCICMVLALLPAIPLVAEAAAPSVLFLKPNNNWVVSNAWFAAYFYGNGDAWRKMADSNGDGIYECDVPSGYPNVIFCRMNPSKTALSWDSKWDQTQDLTIPTNGNNCFTISAGQWNNASGTWSTICQTVGHHSFENNACTMCGVEGRTIYFQNNWQWKDVKLHYWTDGGVATNWPGVDDAYFGEAVVDGATRYYSVLTVPVDADGFIINGTNDQTGQQDQTQNLTLEHWYDGITYYIDDNNYETNDEGKHTCGVKDFPICNDFVNEHKFVNNVCTRCDVTYCQVNGHVDVDGVDDPAADNNDHCDRCDEELMDIFFKNNWNWSDVRLYYWYGGDTVVPANPGLEMEPYGKNHGYDYYRMKVPTGIQGFIVSGYRDDNSGVREQTDNITSGWYDGVTFYPSERSGETTCAVGAFQICIDFPSNHRFETDSKFCKFCNYPDEVTVYFQNNWLWTDVRIHYWGSRIDTTVLEYPGKSMELYDNDGTYDYYYLTIPADCDGIKFSGIKDDGTDTRDESPDITSGWYEDITYSMIWNDGNEVKVFNITEFFPCVHGHTEVTVPATDPTCVDTGWTAGVRCSVCDETLTAQQEIPATGVHGDKDVDGRCDTCACLMAPAQLIKTSASLEGNIAVNYFMLLSEEIKADENAYMQFCIADGDPIQVPISEHKVIGEYYVFTCEVAAKEMTDMITSQFFYSGGSTEEHPYNVKIYGEHILNNPGYDNAKTKNLITSMLNYGAASQAYFEYNTDDLANTGVTTAPDYSNVTIEGFDAVRGQGTENVKLCSASLILNSETTLRLFFNGNITATYQGEPLEVKQRSGLYYVDIVDIAAKDLDELVTVTITDNTNATKDVSFNPLSYCKLVLNDSTGTFDREMKDLAAALYLYNQAANEYFM